MDLYPIIAQAPSLPLLFLVSFLAATVLPLGSEWLLVIMVLENFPLPQTVLTATFGNYLGACTTFILGWYGSQFITRSILRMGENQVKRAEQFYRKYGIWSLLLSWAPIIGDPLCLVAGALKTGWLRFSILVFLGKFTRYATVAYLTQLVLHQS